MRLIDTDAAIEAVCEEVMDRFFVPPSAGYDVAEEALKKLPSIQPDTNCSGFPNNWIPCSERLPEEDTEVLISYRYKEGEGDTDHVNIDITSYGTTCFGGREIHTLKEWRQPFDYFHANYEVIAWMPLPTPYREE